MAPADIEMGSNALDSKTDKDDSGGASPPSPPADPTETLIAELRRNLTVLEKAVHSKELRLIARVLRGTGSLRPRLNVDLVSRFLRCFVPESYPHRDGVLSSLASIPAVPDDAMMQVDQIGDQKKSNASSLSVPSPSMVPEISAYLHLLAILVLLDAKRNVEASTVSRSLVDWISTQNRRTLDEISSRTFFYYSRSIELTGKLSSIRSHLLASYRTAVLRHDAASQAMLLNLLLRNYIAYNLYDQADKLIYRAPFPETRSNNQLARNLYYTGRIKAIQLDYSDALWNLQQALRKAPQNTALGFRTTVQKFMVIVQLLTGEIPERAVFRQQNMEAALKPYLSITKAVRIGDLSAFKDVFKASSETFARDQTTSLIIRLRHNVIKTGLRKLNSSYSRISLADICSRLSLDSVDNTEGIVAKAVLDGVIDAVIDHEGGFVCSKENMDVYSTVEPAEVYHRRVEFCLNIHNEALRAMRFPDTKDDEETPEQRRERLKEHEELVKTLEEEEEDDDMGMFD